MFYLLGTKIDTENDENWPNVVMNKIDDAHNREAINDLRLISYAILQDLIFARTERDKNKA